MLNKLIIGVMGPGNGVSPEITETAYELGKLIAKNNWITLCGGRAAGVMEAVSRGTSEHAGLTIGILPDESRETMNNWIDIPIVTGMGNARNNINVLSSDVIIGCGMGAGTASEIALAMKAGKYIVLIKADESVKHFFSNLGYPLDRVYFSDWPEDVMDWIRQIHS